MAESSRAAVRHAGLEIPEDLMADILARMPATSILRFRAACKCWHHRTKDPAFLLTHHLCQPAQPLFCSRLNVKDQDAFRMGHYCCLELEAVDLPPRMVVRFKGIESIQFNLLAVHGSCDGLLLLSNLDAHFVCNPATRQDRDIDYWEYYVLTVGFQEQERRIERRASSDSVAQALATDGLERSVIMPPVFLHGSLLLVFETDDESFRSMSPPVISEYSKCFMFGTKEGKLALSSWDQDGWMAKLWIMQDYENQAWAFTYKIQVPLENRVGKDEPLDDVTIVSEDGDMLVEFMSARTVLHYDKNGSLLRTLKCDGPSMHFTRHFLKESLVDHPFLHKQWDHPAGPPFFKGFVDLLVSLLHAVSW
ncbi:hypothetical protein QOZ80_3AG0245060 [Eleusine coracana subsp. coracana]|nr:hypothetical protein QOZ80_3AG0245060 [Eleusine coracana subsp. coracana]